MMATKKCDLLIEREFKDQDLVRIYTDSDTADRVRSIVGVAGVEQRNDHFGRAVKNSWYVAVDPRYDWDEVIAEIDALNASEEHVVEDLWPKDLFNTPLHDYCVEVEEIVTVKVEVQAKSYVDACNEAVKKYDSELLFSHVGYGVKTIAGAVNSYAVRRTDRMQSDYAYFDESLVRTDAGFIDDPEPEN
jgi:hypothetical protein